VSTAVWVREYGWFFYLTDVVMFMQKGDCFEAAFKYLMQLPDEKRAQGHTLVHGIVKHPEHGRLIHAWVEREPDEYVIDVSNGRHSEVRRLTFVTQFQVQDLVRYSPMEANAQNVLSRHYGPWHISFNGVREGLC
jgi:hypothetical protein